MFKWKTNPEFKITLIFWNKLPSTRAKSKGQVLKLARTHGNIIWNAWVAAIFSKYGEVRETGSAHLGWLKWGMHTAVTPFLPLLVDFAARSAQIPPHCSIVPTLAQLPPNAGGKAVIVNWIPLYFTRMGKWTWYLSFHLCLEDVYLCEFLRL